MISNQSNQLASGLKREWEINHSNIQKVKKTQEDEKAKGSDTLQNIEKQLNYSDSNDLVDN